MRALITGVTGQDGSYLAEQLLAAGHDVYGLTRRAKVLSPATLLTGDLLDQDSLESALQTCLPDVVFNLAAVTSPGGAWGTKQPPLLAEVTGVGVVRLLDAMLNVAPEARLVHASSSAILDPERYGIYGAAKRFAHDCVVGYRSRLWCANAVLFSHASPRQDPRFLIRRICTMIAHGQPLVLTDVTSRRDWGWAPDYMKALQAIADQPEPGDWTVASGDTRAVQDIVRVAEEFTGRQARIVIDPQWVPDEIPAEFPTVPGWKPDTSFEDMVRALCLSPA